MILPSRLFQPGYESCLERPSYIESDVFSPGRSSVLEDLVFYWSKKRPPTFDCQDLTLLSLAYYPLKIGSAEWTKYTEAMSHIIKQYEYSTQVSVESQGLAKLDSDIRALQVWGRRCTSTLCKLRAVIRFVKARTKQAPDSDLSDLIIEDYACIASMVETYSHRIEAMIPVINFAGTDRG